MTEAAPSVKNTAQPTARRAALWASAGHIGGEGLRLLNNVVMARLLTPDAFGLMALVNTFVQGLKMFSDIGITMNIVQSTRSKEPVFLNTAWTLQAIRGVSLFIAMCVIAWPVASFYGHAELPWLLVVTGVGVLVSGFNSTALATQNRELRLDRLTTQQLVAQAVSIVAMVCWAWFYPSVWAFVVGSLVSSVVTMALSHRLDRSHKDWFAWDAVSRKELITFGRWIFVSTALTFLAAQTDRLVLGKLVPLETLGLYGIALGISRMSEQFISMLSHRVLFAVLSREKLAQRELLRARLLTHRRKLLLILMALALVPITAGDLIVYVMYPERYAGAGSILSTLSLGGWVVGLTVTAKQALFAIGVPKYNALATALRFLLVLIGLPLAFHTGGIGAVVVVVAFAELPVYVVNSVGLRRHGLGCLLQDLLLTLLVGAVVAAVLVARVLLGFGTPWGPV